MNTGGGLVLMRSGLFFVVDTFIQENARNAQLSLISFYFIKLRLTPEFYCTRKGQESFHFTSMLSL